MTLLEGSAKRTNKEILSLSIGGLADGIHLEKNMKALDKYWLFS